METINWNDWFICDDSSPSCLRWKVDRHRGFGDGQVFIHAGDVAGSVGSDGYFRTCLFQDEYRCHRIVFEMFYGVLDAEDVVDHLDGDKTNNRIGNLRKTTVAGNRRNLGMNSRNTSGVTGVMRHTVSSRGKTYDYWTANWGVNGQHQKKSFNVAKFGEVGAFTLACNMREKMIEQLNAGGAGYTERHGKEGG